MIQRGPENHNFFLDDCKHDANFKLSVHSCVSCMQYCAIHVRQRHNKTETSICSNELWLWRSTWIWIVLPSHVQNLHVRLAKHSKQLDHCNVLYQQPLRKFVCKCILKTLNWRSICVPYNWKACLLAASKVSYTLKYTFLAHFASLHDVFSVALQPSICQ
jgi:hypothetical protein